MAERGFVSPGDAIIARRMARVLVQLQCFDEYEDRVGVLDEKGRVEAILATQRNIAHRLIEEFMLLANQTVASKRRPGARPFSSSRAVWSVRSSAHGPRTDRSRRPMLSRRTIIRPGPDARAQTIAESVVTSPVRAAEGRVIRSRS